jgi:hypothetical protein
MVLADKRYQRADKRDKLPPWITQHLKARPGLGARGGGHWAGCRRGDGPGLDAATRSR